MLRWRSFIVDSDDYRSDISLIVPLAAACQGTRRRMHDRPTTRLAAALVLLYGIRVSKLVTLRTEDILRQKGLVFVRLGREPLALPDELGSIAVAAVEARTTARLFGPSKNNAGCSLVPTSAGLHPPTRSPIV